MLTNIIKLNKDNLDFNAIEYAANVIQQGGLVAFPTETVYGLGANALSAEAVRKIFKAKNRPEDNPLIVHIWEKAELKKYAQEIPDLAWKLVDAFWPGPLSLLLEKTSHIPDAVTAGSPLVSLRLPDHPVALALIRLAGVPIAAPSANLSTRPSPTTAQHVISDLYGKVDIILDAGPVDIGVESTVVDITSAPPVILRPGGISLETLKNISPDMQLYSGNSLTARSPGMKYKHYAPNCDVYIFFGSKTEIIRDITHEYQRLDAKSIPTWIIAKQKFVDIPIKNQHILKTEKEYAKEIFSLFRKAEEYKAKVILVEGIEEKGLGLAVMNRLKKAGKPF